jgi:hypothetical protein
VDVVIFILPRTSNLLILFKSGEVPMPTLSSVIMIADDLGRYGVPVFHISLAVHDEEVIG